MCDEISGREEREEDFASGGDENKRDHSEHELPKDKVSNNHWTFIAELMNNRRPQFEIVAKRFLNTQHKDLAGDIVQEAIVALSNAPTTAITDDTHLGNLFRLLIRQAVGRFYNRLYHEKEKNSDSSDHLETEPPNKTAARDPAKRMIDRELSIALKSVLLALPDKAQEILNLRVIDDLSHAEIAEILDISEEATRKRYLRSLQLAREEWQRQGWPSEWWAEP